VVIKRNARIVKIQNTTPALPLPEKVALAMLRLHFVNN
jgi:hypothetical protein